MNAVVFGYVLRVVDRAKLDFAAEVIEQLSCKLFAWRLSATLNARQVRRIAIHGGCQLGERYAASAPCIPEGLITHGFNFAGHANLCQPLILRGTL